MQKGVMQMVSLENKTAFITGASRGIGAAIAVRLAQAGANVVVCAKSSEAQPPGVKLSQFRLYEV